MYVPVGVREGVMDPMELELQRVRSHWTQD